MAAGAPPLSSPGGAAPLAYPSAVLPYGGPYAGFWLRFVAYLIDSAVLGLSVGLLLVIGGLLVGVGFFRNLGDEISSGDQILAPIGALLVFLLILFALGVTWLYYAWFESSRYQGTPGKMALGLMVTDLAGRRVTFARATGRVFAKLITALVPLFIGYIMAGFTAKKQALHDMIAGCLVLRRV
jgi:uncharacterized RDD family membrane protein YckC